MWNGIGWYGFIGVITTSTTDISLRLAMPRYINDILSYEHIAQRPMKTDWLS